MINVMDEYITYTGKCFRKYMKYICGKKYEKNIADRYIEAYINVRYSNYIDEESKKLSLQKKVYKVLNDTTKELISENGEKANIINCMGLFAGYLYNLDQLYLLESHKKTIEKINEDRNRIFQIEDKEFITEFSLMLREDIKNRKDFLENFSSQTFYLDYKKIGKNECIAELKNKIVFPDLYSDVAIEKAGMADTVSEDMNMIALLQVSSNIVTDIMNCCFDKTYYVYLPKSIFDKKTKINRVFNIIDSPFTQDRIRILITYECFKRYKSYVMQFMRDGFVFGIHLDDSFDYSSENIEFLELFDKILLDSNKYYYKDMKNSVKIRDRIVRVDEVK